jgi:hypothetical protein
MAGRVFVKSALARGVAGFGGRCVMAVLSEWELDLRRREAERRQFEVDHPDIVGMRGLLRAENTALRRELDRLRAFIRAAGLAIAAEISPGPEMEELLRRPIEDVAWPSERIRRTIGQARWFDGEEWHGVKTLDDVVCCTEGDLLRTGNFGRTSLDALKKMLAGMHLYLRY